MDKILQETRIEILPNVRGETPKKPNADAVSLVNGELVSGELVNGDSSRTDRAALLYIA